MYLPYVYKLTDKETGKWYIGSRISETDGCYPEELGVRYFTSSKLIAPLFRANPARFTVEIIVTSEDADYILAVEKSILEFRNAKKDPESYNMHHNDGKMNTVKSGKLTSERMKRECKGVFDPKHADMLKKVRSEAGKSIANRKVGVHSLESIACRKYSSAKVGNDNFTMKRGIFSSEHDRSSRKEPWWYNPITGETKRTWNPPEGFLPGRGKIKV